MTLFHRRILTTVFFFVLIVVGPLLISYGAGYRFNVKQKRIERVGLLHITTEPNEATMAIDSKTYAIDKELVLTGLSPRKYDITVNKEGYHSWTKNLEIFPNETTFVRDLNLFKNEAAEVIQISTAKYQETLNQLTLLQNQTELQVIDLETEQKFVYQLPSAFEIVYPQLIDSETLLFAQNTSWYLAKNNTLTPLQLPITETILDAEYANEVLTYLTSTGIWSINITQDQKPVQIVKQALIKDVFVADNEYWFLAAEPSSQNLFLNRTTSKSDRPDLVTTFPYEQGFELVDVFKGFVTISNDDTNQLLLIDTNSSPASVEQIQNARDWQWSDDHKQLLVASEFELTVLHFDGDRRQELLLRLSSPFSDTAWDTEEKHAFLVTENSLRLVERDERDRRNIIEFVQNKKGLHILYLTKSGETLYILADSDENNLEKELIKINLR
jgi:hypothetical protein